MSSEPKTGLPGGEPAEYRIVGQLCEPDDLATARLIPEIREGDLLGTQPGA